MITHTMTVEGHLGELGIKLPAPPTPLGAYVESSDTGNLLFLSGMLPVADGKLGISGRLGANLTVKQGQEAARIASLNVACSRESAPGLAGPAEEADQADGTDGDDRAVYPPRGCR